MVSGCRAGSRGDKLESADSAILTIFQVAMSGIDVNGYSGYTRGDNE
jgi:hypothetical protein